ncbi:tripartite motif-containing protein 15-like [Gopherus flavomarginatus]|uniref:tripartite motif-containing protein 15-like n=1 Tax=Gopherus flavomarginatus TaxID=286002 RepID=UPI0021CBC26C|nr:tripartite motif-containing protein 15-like [Gopherus flavomarginatus]
MVHKKNRLTQGGLSGLASLLWYLFPSTQLSSKPWISYSTLLLSRVLLTQRPSHANVTLDPDTAHPELVLSEDRRSVSRGHKSQMLPYKLQRFDYLLSVLGSEGFNSGKHSWQVKVEGGAAADWAVGVARQSVQRNGEVGFTPEEGVWVVQKWGSVRDYRAQTFPVTRLSLSRDPSRIRVSLDYEGGLVAFNYADNLAPIFTFPRASFNGEKIFPFFWIWGTGFKLSLHP